MNCGTSDTKIAPRNMHTEIQKSIENVYTDFMENYLQRNIYIKNNGQE